MLTLFIWIIVVLLVYRLWKFFHWFFFINLDKNGKDPSENFINNFFNRLYNNQAKYVEDQIYKNETPKQREQRLKKRDLILKEAKK